MSKTDAEYSARLTIYEALIATQPGIERRGKKNHYTSMNGNMFSFLAADGTICIRLSDADRKVFAETFDASPVLQYGAVMKEYVAISDTLLADPDELSAYFERSVAHARSLKPKPTKR